MPLRLSLWVLFGVVFMSTLSTTDPANAQCSPGDFVCEKFSRSKPAAKPARRPPRRARPSVTRSRTPETTSAEKSEQATDRRDDSADEIQTSMVSPIPSTAPPVQVTTLPPGSIEEAPQEIANLVFGSADRIEAATAKCRPAPHSLRRVACSVAIHHLALTSGAGAGCLANLKMRDIELTRDAAGRWRHEEAIALCGGRLIRRTELFPVALNGQPQFALREEYEMLGGDQKCAAPYLRTRLPLERTFMPIGPRRSRQLQCGRVTAR